MTSIEQLNKTYHNDRTIFFIVKFFLGRKNKYVKKLQRKHIKSGFVWLKAKRAAEETK